MKQRYKRGVALMTVLGVAFVLSMLTGALVGTQQGNFALIVSSVNQKQALLAANSGMDYAKFRLSRDRTLGTANASNDVSYAGFEVKERSAGSGTITVDATFPGSVPPKSFSVTIENRLGSGADPARGLPKACVVISTTGRCGTFQSQLESVLVQAPLYDAAAISNGAMDMANVDIWTIKSQDKLRNWIRSNEDIVTPGFLSDPTKNLTFDLSVCPIPGVAWSKKEVFVGDRRTKIDGTNYLDAYSKTTGLMAPHATLNYNIYDLKREDLNKPPGTDVTIPAGEYVVNTQRMTYVEENAYWTRWGWRVSRTNHTVDVAGLVYTDSSGTKQQWLKGSVAPQETGWTPTGWGSRRVTEVKMQDGTLMSARPDVKVQPDVVNIANNFSSNQMTFDFNSSKFSAFNDLPLRVDGDLSITADSSAAARIPSLSFDPNPAAPVSPTPSTVFGYLYSTTAGTKKGDIRIQGSVAGSGAIAAQNDLHVAGSSNVSASASNLGLVLWAGHDIKFGVQGDTDMNFKGLVYAKNNVSLDFTDNANGLKLRNLNLEGALVAQTGNIQMGQAQNVTMTYDPKYLDIFTKGLPHNTARFAQVAFKAN